MVSVYVHYKAKVFFNPCSVPQGLKGTTNQKQHIMAETLMIRRLGNTETGDLTDLDLIEHILGALVTEEQSP